MRHAVVVMKKKNSVYQGELWFVKSVSKKQQVDFSKPPSEQDLLDNCTYVDCDENDVARVRNIVQSHIDYLHGTTSRTLSLLISIIGWFW